MDRSQPAPDATHFLHYALGTKLGESKNGTTWQAWDTGLERVVVVKFLAPEVHYPEETRARILAENERLCRDRGAPFAEYHDWGEADGRQYVIREYISGQTLDTYLPDALPNHAEFMRIAVQASAALVKAHQVGIALENITLSNLLLDKHGRLWVLDHGLSAVPTAAGRRDDLIYLAPEILAGESATEWSDLYALGVAFCLLVTGRPPYPADSVEQLRQLILSTPVNIPDNRSRPLRPELRLLLEKLLAHRPNDRFRDAEELAVTIDEIRRQEVEEPLAEPLDHPPAHRSPRFYLVVSAVVLLVLIVWMLLITTGGR